MFVEPDKCRKAFHFDLDYHSLCEEFGAKNTATAYYQIKVFMTEHGFEKPQYSGYISNSPMTDSEFYRIYNSLKSRYPWFERCAKQVHVSVILDSYDLLHFGSQENEADLQPVEPEYRSLSQVEKEVRALFETDVEAHSIQHTRNDDIEH